MCMSSSWMTPNALNVEKQPLKDAQDAKTNGTVLEIAN